MGDSSFMLRPSAHWSQLSQGSGQGQRLKTDSRRFDLAFGIVLPILCFALDPIVFRSWIMGRGMLEQFQFYAYTLSAIEVVALCVWLFPARGADGGIRRPAALAGVLLAGGVFSSAVGLLILPFTVVGLVYLVGVLGFVPFGTAVVYLRAGRRAARLSRGGGLRAGAAASLACGFVFALGAPAAAQWSARRAAAAALADLSEGKELSRARLNALRLAASVSGPSAYDDLVTDYGSESDRVRRARMAQTYRDITGGEIDRRLAILRD